MEEDGTPVDEDEFLSFLTIQTVLLLLVDGEEWTPKGKVSSSFL
jgi:hypothetical protein